MFQRERGLIIEPHVSPPLEWFFPLSKLPIILLDASTALD